MEGRELSVTAEYLGSLDHGADWRAEIEAFADDHGVDAGWFWAMGAVQDAEIWYYDQTDRAELSQVAADHGLYSHIRPLTDDEVVTVTHEDPGPFFPD